MSTQTDLFGRGSGPVDVAPEAASYRGVASRLPSALRLGTSSWSFPGWTGVVYDRPAGSRVLARHGLTAYARHPLLRTVGVDRSYYRPMEATAWRDYAAVVPPDFRFVTKAERALVQPEDAAFLDADYATEAVVEPYLEGVGDRAGPILFQLSPLPPGAVGGPRRFAERLYRFLSALPAGPEYAVEIRTPELMTPDYAAALRHAGAVHGYVVHPRMLPLAEQLRRLPPEAPATEGGVGPFLLRWMLREGLAYEEARDLYEPFDRLVDEDPQSRSRVGRAVIDALEAGRNAFVVVNNKAEGSSPLSVIRLAEWISDEWAPERGGADRGGAETDGRPGKEGHRRADDSPDGGRPPS